MIGGDLYAHTILGVDICDSENKDEDNEDENIRFLILDPHYCGSDSNIKTIL